MIRQHWFRYPSGLGALWCGADPATRTNGTCLGIFLFDGYSNLERNTSTAFVSWKFVLIRLPVAGLSALGISPQAEKGTSVLSETDDSIIWGSNLVCFAGLV